MSLKQLYELMILFRGDFSEAEIKKEIEAIKKDLEASGAEKIEEDYWGRKSLAYKVGPEFAGYYTFLKLLLAKSAAEAANRKLGSNDKIVRRMFTKVGR